VYFRALGVSVYYILNTAPEVLDTIPRECTFSYKEEDIQPKPEGPELNRAHKDQFIHYEETAEGIEFVGFEELLNYPTLTSIPLVL
jgi:hypothetical protein